MEPSKKLNISWWKYPFKPVRISKEKLIELNLGEYLGEPKLDGWRCLAITHNGYIKLWTREKTKIEITDNLVPQIQALNLPDGTVLDGEIWTPSKRGKWRQNPKVHCQIGFWDVIRLGKTDLSKTKLEHRRSVLEHLVEGKCHDITVVDQFNPSTEKIEAIELDARQHREVSNIRSGYIHGVVLKRKGSPRRDHSNRSTEHPDWLKIVFEGMDSGM
jgi:ATP-dependent DNA ligase